MPFTIGGDYIPNKEPSSKSKKSVVVRKEKRKKGFITAIYNLDASGEALSALARDLKKHLACGGCIKNGTIELQGDKVEQTKKFLKTKGIKNS